MMRMRDRYLAYLLYWSNYWAEPSRVSCETMVVFVSSIYIPFGSFQTPVILYSSKECA